MKRHIWYWVPSVEQVLGFYLICPSSSFLHLCSHRVAVNSLYRLLLICMLNVQLGAITNTIIEQTCWCLVQRMVLSFISHLSLLGLSQMQSLRESQVFLQHSRTSSVSLLWQTVFTIIDMSALS